MHEWMNTFYLKECCQCFFFSFFIISTRAFNSVTPRVQRHCHSNLSWIIPSVANKQSNPSCFVLTALFVFYLPASSESLLWNIIHIQQPPHFCIPLLLCIYYFLVQHNHMFNWYSICIVSMVNIIILFP